MADVRVPAFNCRQKLKVGESAELLIECRFCLAMSEARSLPQPLETSRAGAGVARRMSRIAMA